MRKIKKILITCISLILAFSFAACGNNIEVSEGKQILGDSNFKNGFSVTGQVSSDVSTTDWKYCDTINYQTSAVWRLGQWGRLMSTREGYDAKQHDLSLGLEPTGVEEQEGEHFLLSTKSGSKKVDVNPSSGEIVLRVDSSLEYLDTPRMENEDWPHLIIEQGVGGMVLVGSAKEIWVEIDFELLEQELINDKTGAAQFQWIFSIRDTESPINDYQWFNIPIYDNRWDFSPGMSIKDGGKEDATGKHMYSPKGTEFMSEPAKVGKKIKIKKDFKPYFITAFNEAKKHGALEQSKLEDMALNSLNIGWEVSNISKVSARISNLKLTVVE